MKTQDGRALDTGREAKVRKSEGFREVPETRGDAAWTELHLGLVPKSIPSPWQSPETITRLT